MARRTRKVGGTGRYGARYGVKGRRQNEVIEKRQHAAHSCPSCGAPRVHRISTGIWQCRKCTHTFAGGAYLPVVTHQSVAAIGARQADYSMSISSEALEALAVEAKAQVALESGALKAGGFSGKAVENILTSRPNPTFYEPDPIPIESEESEAPAAPEPAAEPEVKEKKGGWKGGRAQKKKKDKEE